MHRQSLEGACQFDVAVCSRVELQFRLGFPLKNLLELFQVNQPIFAVDVSNPKLSLKVLERRRGQVNSRGAMD
jgi:hypothetical protein